MRSNRRSHTVTKTRLFSSRLLIRRLLLAALLLGAAGSFAVENEGPKPDDVVVVVSRQNPLLSLTLEQVENIFLGRTQQYPNNQRAVPIDQAEGSAVRERFYREILGRTSTQVRAYWSRILFTGRGHPPRSVSSDEEVLRILAADPQAIGYIERRFVSGAVTVVLE